MNRRYRFAIKTFVVILLIAGFLYTPFYTPPEAHAQVVSSIMKCVKIVAIQAIIRAVISIIIAIIWSVPVTDSASTADLIKEYFEDPFMRCMAREVQDSTINGILTIVRERGRDGGAGFIRNWRNFFTNAEYRGENVFRAMLFNTPVCGWLRQGLYSSFGVDSRSNISLAGLNLRVGNLDPYMLRGRCPLPAGFNVSGFEADPWNNGGYQAMMALSDPSSVPLWISVQSSIELDRQREAEKDADKGETTSDGVMAQRGAVVGTGGGAAGSGVFCKSDAACLPGETCGSKTCQESPAGPVPDVGMPCALDSDCASNICGGSCQISGGGGGSGGEAPCRLRGPNNKCIVYNDIRTPAGAIAGAIDAITGGEFSWITSVDELKEMVITFLSQRVANRLLDMGGRERDSSFTDNPAPSVTIPPYPSTTPVPGYTDPPIPGGPGGGPGCPQSPVLAAAVNSAIDDFINTNPAMFAADRPNPDILGATDPYVLGVVALLQSRGYQARLDPNAGERDIIDVNTPANTEEWDIMRGGFNNGGVRRFYLATLCPAYF